MSSSFDSLASRARMLGALATVFAVALFLVACGDDDGGTSTPSAVDNIPAESGEPAGGAPAGEEPASGGEPSGGAVEQAAVNIVDFDYDPDPVTIKAGGSVEFTNSDAARHTATGDDKEIFDTGNLAKGDAMSVTLDEPGTYDYICLFHPFMTGSVEVVQ